MAKPTRPLRLLPDDHRSRFQMELARLLGAGLDPIRALGALEGDRVTEPRVAACLAALGRGRTLTQAASGAGLLSAFEAAAMKVAEAAGAVDAALLSLSERTRRSVERWNRIRARSTFPAAVLGLGVAVGPLPEVAAGRTSQAAYVATVALSWIAIYLVWRSLGSARARAVLLAPGKAIATLLPRVRALDDARRRAMVLGSLALLQIAGMPMRESAGVLRRTVDTGADRAAVTRFAASLQRGRGVADALAEAGLLGGSDFALIDSAEAAGRLDSALGRAAAGYEDELDGAADFAAEWAPRIVYFVIAGYVVSRWIF